LTESRVCLCPSLEKVKGVSPFKVTVKLRITGPNAPPPQEKVVTVNGSELVSADFIFTLSPGVYYIWVRVDPDEQYVEHSDDLAAYISNVKVAQLQKSLKLKFVAIDLPMSFSPDWATPMEREFFSFCTEQVRFMKQVYPLPPSRITYGYALADPPQRAKASRLTLTLWLANMARQEEWGLLRDKRVLLKNVGLLPDRWWGKEEAGCAFPVVQRSACLVKYNKTTLKSVTAHEVGHTLGLYIYPGLEQYQQFPKWGLPVDHHIILKNGKLYNLLIEDEAKLVFPTGIYVEPAAPVYCFMGRADTDRSTTYQNLHGSTCHRSFIRLRYNF
jgi:hypothetical protein